MCSFACSSHHSSASLNDESEMRMLACCDTEYGLGALIGSYGYSVVGKVIGRLICTVFLEGQPTLM